MTIFLNYWDFEWKNCRFHRDFTWNCWNYQKKGVNRNSRLRTEVKYDSVKCWKLILSVNIPWSWIYSPITKLKMFSRNIWSKNEFILFDSKVQCLTSSQTNLPWNFQIHFSLELAYRFDQNNILMKAYNV